MTKWLNYHHLFYFWTVSRTGSFTKAATELATSQSSLSHQIKALEEALNMRLLHRGRRQELRITDEGKAVLQYADNIFATGQQLLEWSQGHVTQTTLVRIGVLAGLSRNLQLLFLEPLLANPGVRFQVITGDHERLTHLFEDFRIDLILTTKKFSSSEGLPHRTHLLGQSPLVMVAAPKRTRRRDSLKTLLDGQSVYLPAASSELRPEIEAYFEKHRVEPNVVGEVDDIALLRLLALSGQALAIIPRIGVVKELETRELRIVQALPSLKQSYYAISRTTPVRSPLVELLIEKFRGV